MNSRRMVLLVVVLVLAALVVGFYPHYVQTPSKDGPGPLSVQLDAGIVAPEYHSPLADWRIRHMDVLDRGELTQADCLYCHRPARSCTNCHGYVGVKAIVE